MKLFFSCILPFLAIGLIAQTPKYSNEFLSIGVGGRSLAMSGSCISSVDDINSAYWNPAGLSRLKNDMELGLMHAEYFAGLAKYDYGAIAFKTSDSSAFGLSLVRFGVDNIPNTLELIDSDGNIRYDRISSFSVADYAFLITYSKASRIKGLRFGGNMKIIRRKAGDFASAWGFGIDIGLQYHINKWTIGITGRDISTTFNAWKYNTENLEEVFILTGNEIPENSTEITLPRFLAGISRNFHISTNFSVNAELGIDITTDGKRNVIIKGDPFSIDPHFGFEIGFKQIVYFRGGVGNFQTISDFENKQDFTFQPNIGIGLKIQRLSIDYALTDIGDQSLSLFSNVFSIKYAIDKKN
jgi:hypothetical protein